MSVSKRITIEELQSYLWNSAVLLRTNIDAGAYKQYIFPLLFFKRICDVYDEECQQILAEYGDEEALEWEENHRFIVPKGAHWKDVRSVSENIGVAITDATNGVYQTFAELKAAVEALDGAAVLDQMLAPVGGDLPAQAVSGIFIIGIPGFPGTGEKCHPDCQWVWEPDKAFRAWVIPPKYGLRRYCLPRHIKLYKKQGSLWASLRSATSPEKVLISVILR